MSTLRLRFGEPVRFRFLIGMLSSGAGASSPQLQSVGLRFVNTFLEAAPSPQLRLYIQAEIEQAGLLPSSIRKVRK
jgi:Diaphanous FH3 Domain